MNGQSTVIEHLIEAEKTRISALRKLETLDSTKLTVEQRKLLGAAMIFILGSGVQIKLASDKIGNGGIE